MHYDRLSGGGVIVATPHLTAVTIITIGNEVKVVD